MIRGTTPQHTFELPSEFASATITALYITYAQDGTTLIEKSLSDATVSGSTVTVTLTQAETLLLTAGKYETVSIQVRVKTSAGYALASEIIKEPVYDVLKDGEI